MGRPGQRGRGFGASTATTAVRGPGTCRTALCAVTVTVIAPPAPAPAASMADRLAQLKELGELLSAGVLTQAEFEQQKARILNS